MDYQELKSLTNNKLFNHLSYHRHFRVLHVITGLNTGGAERSLYNILAGGLVDSFDNAIVSLTDAGAFGASIRDMGVPVYALQVLFRGLPLLRAGSRLNRLVKDFQPDIVQGWMYHGNLAARTAMLFSQKKAALVWNVRHSLYGLSYEKNLTRQVIRANMVLSSSPDVILYNSQMSRWQHEVFGFSKVRGQVVPNGFSMQPQIASLENRKDIRRKLDISDSAFLVGHAARFHPMKNHAGFLRAAVVAAERFDDLCFLLCGRDVISTNKRLLDIVPQKMRNRFYFLGERSDVVELMAAMDVFCSSSSWGEAFPNVLGEAMVAGVPCIATDVGDSKYIIGSTGIIVPPRDESALVDALWRVRLIPLTERQALGRAARTRIGNNFALESVVEKYKALYKRLMVRK